MKKRQGFTIIEVALFIAISGLILMGVIISTSNSINQQRYNDSVQSFADFLRSIYSEVSDPKSSGNGRSDKAIYGKLVTFGEENDSTFYIYDIIGGAEGKLGGADVLSSLKALNASPIIKTKNNDNTYTTSFAGFEETYTPTWGAQIHVATITDNELGLTDKAALLIIRSPMSGIIYTYTLAGETIEVKKAIADSSDTNPNFTNPLTDYLKKDKFKLVDIDFCLKAEGVTVFGGAMRDIRIVGNAHNASDVNIIDVSAEIGTGVDNNRCKRES